MKNEKKMKYNEEEWERFLKYARTQTKTTMSDKDLREYFAR